MSDLSTFHHYMQASVENVRCWCGKPRDDQLHKDPLELVRSLEAALAEEREKNERLRYLLEDGLEHVYSMHRPTGDGCVVEDWMRDARAALASTGSEE